MYFCPLDELQGLILIAIYSHVPASVDVEGSQIWNYYDYLNLRQFKTSIVNPSYPIAPPPHHIFVYIHANTRIEHAEKT